jgi:hypothetical protein
VLFALWARRHAAGSSCRVAAAAALLTFASLATGWVLAVDGYLGRCQVAAVAWPIGRAGGATICRAGGAHAP